MLLSILIPVYNAELYISRCLNSIVMQDYYGDNVEIVAINDGSKDGSLNILNEYADKYNNIHIFSRENKGIGPTRNELLENANGRFFWFVDADDYVADSSLEMILNKITTDKYDLIFLSYYFINKEGKQLQHFSGEYSNGYELIQNGIYRNSVWSRVYRTSVAKQNGIQFLPIIMGEDFDFIFRLTTYIKNVYCINRPMYYYVANSNSAICNPNINHKIHAAKDSLKCIEYDLIYLESLNSKDSSVLRIPLNAFIIGYIYSLLFGPIHNDVVDNFIERMVKMGVFPIKPLPSNFKHAILVVIFNFRVTRLLALLLRRVLIIS